MAAWQRKFHCTLIVHVTNKCELERIYSGGLERTAWDGGGGRYHSGVSEDDLSIVYWHRHCEPKGLFLCLLFHVLHHTREPSSRTQLQLVVQREKYQSADYRVMEKVQRKKSATATVR